MPSLPAPDADVNSHEFKIIDNKQNVLLLYDRGIDRNVTELPGQDPVTYTYLDTCMMDMNLETRKPNFEWCPLDHDVSPDEALVDDPTIAPLKDYL